MTWSSGYTAFVVDAYAGVIAGWECSLTKDAAFVVDAYAGVIAGWECSLTKDAAFVVDAYAGVIAGWECSLTKDAAFVERALRHGLPDSPRSPVWRSYSSSRRRKSVYCNIFRQDTDASRAAAVDRHCWRRPRQRLM